MAAVADFWLQYADNVKVCFIESKLALMRSYENIANEKQYLRIIDSLNSDSVQYMLGRHPMPHLTFNLPPAVEEVRQKRIQLRDMKGIEPVPIMVAIYGYNNYSRAIIESYR